MSISVRSAFAGSFASGVIYSHRDATAEPAPAVEQAPAPTAPAAPIQLRQVRDGQERGKARPFVTIERPADPERFRRAS